MPCAPNRLAQLADVQAAGGQIPPANLPASWVTLSQVLGPGVTSDTSLAFGSGTAQGVDRSAAIASMMSGRFGSGNVRILWDLKLTGRVPIYGSNVTIQAVPGCGVRRPQGQTGPTFFNAQQVAGLDISTGLPVYPAPYGVSEVTLGGYAQSGISIIGLTVHGGAATGQSAFEGDSWGVGAGMLFWGVEDLLVERCTVYDTKSYLIAAANVHRARFLGNVVQIGGSTGSTGQDGFHLNGPAKDVLGQGNFICSRDDGMPISPNDGDVSGTAFPFARPGDITDVRYIGNHFDNAAAAFRIISTDRVADRILLSGNTGTCLAYSLVMDQTDAAVFPGGGQGHPGPGKIGSVIVRDHDVQPSLDPIGVGNIFVNASFDSLRIEGWKVRTTPSIAATPQLWIYSSVTYHSLHCDLDYTDTDTANTPRMLIRDDGNGRLVTIRARVARPGSGSGLANAAIPVYRKTAGSLLALDADIVAESINNPIDYAGGTIGSIALRGVHKNAGSGNGSVSVAAGLTLPNLATHGLVTALAKSGAGSVTHQYPTGETYSL